MIECDQETIEFIIQIFGMEKLTTCLQSPKIAANAFDFLNIRFTRRSKQTTEIDARIRGILRCLFVIIASWECAEESVCQKACNLILAQ